MSSVTIILYMYLIIDTHTHSPTLTYTHTHTHTNTHTHTHTYTHTHTHTHSHTCSDPVHSAVVWLFIWSLLLPRLAAVCVVVYLIFRSKGHLQPTFLAKVFLCVATVLSLMEDIPNSVTTIAPGRHSCTCLLGVLTLYDVLQLLGIVAFLFYLMFVRSQYLRVEQVMAPWCDM